VILSRVNAALPAQNPQDVSDRGIMGYPFSRPSIAKLAFGKE